MTTNNLIDIGKTIGSSKPMQLDVPTLLETRAEIIASSGGGKSYMLRKLLEQLHPMVQTIVFDWDGDFVTLREKLSYVIVGEGRDRSISVKHAAELARVTLEKQFPLICDVSGMKQGLRSPWVAAFLNGLMEAPKDLWHPVAVIIDEAHIFCPQNGDAESHDAVIDLCSRGRRRGFCGILASQRLSKLDKDACAELLNKFIGRTSLAADQARAADELGLRTKDDRLSLAGRMPGEFHGFGPAFRTDGQNDGGVALFRCSKVETTHPKVGARLNITAPKLDAKMTGILDDLSKLPEEAERKHKTEEDLRRENIDLRRKLTLAEKGQTVPAGTQEKIQRLEEECRTWKKSAEAANVFLTKATRRLEALSTIVAQKLQAVIETCQSSASEAASYNVQIDDPKRSIPELVRRATAPTPKPQAATQRPLAANSPSIPTEGLSASQQRLLNALAAFEAIGMDQVNKVTLAAMAKCSPTSGGYFNNLGRLRTLGYIEYPSGGMVNLTAEGRKIAEHDVPLESLSQYHGYWLGILPTSQGAILSALLDKYPKSIRKDELAESLGVSPTSGGYFNNLGRLRTLRAIEYPAPGEAKASDLLFPEGLS